MVSILSDVLPTPAIHPTGCPQKSSHAISAESMVEFLVCGTFGVCGDDRQLSIPRRCSRDSCGYSRTAKASVRSGSPFCSLQP